jgi:hypothetical protein
MVSSSYSIHFYIDDKGHAIPASIINQQESSRLIENLPLDSSEPVMASTLQSSSKTRLLIYATLALTSASLLGFTLFNHSPAYTETTTGQQTKPTQVQNPITASAIQTTPTSYAEVLQNAQRLAQRANTFTQSAQSVDDWNLAANQLKQAIALLEAIPATSAEHTVAQQKANEYQTRLTSLLERADQPITNIMPTTTITVSNGVACRELETLPDAPPVMLTNVSFDPSTQSGEAANVVGCISNHTGRAVSNVSILYRGSSSTDSSLFQADTATIYVGRIEPGQTVPFRSDFTIHPQLTSVSIESITWESTDSSEPQTNAIAVNFSREQTTN